MKKAMRIEMDETIQNPNALRSPEIQYPQGFIPLTSLGAAPSKRLDLASIRAKLAGASGQQYWRSLEELAETEEFQRYLQKEFPHQAPSDMSPLSRRAFFRVMGATL